MDILTYKTDAGPFLIHVQVDLIIENSSPTKYLRTHVFRLFGQLRESFLPGGGGGTSLWGRMGMCASFV